MVKFVAPTVAVRLMRRDKETGKLGHAGPYHLARAKDPTTTVCGQEVCERCKRVLVADIRPGEPWCIRCLGAFKVK